jgi:hypothetical protein
MNSAQNRTVPYVYQHDDSLFGVLGCRSKREDQNLDTLFSVPYTLNSDTAGPFLTVNELCTWKVEFFTFASHTTDGSWLNRAGLRL